MKFIASAALLALAASAALAEPAQRPTTDKVPTGYVSAELHAKRGVDINRPTISSVSKVGADPKWVQKSDNTSASAPGN